MTNLPGDVPESAPSAVARSPLARFWPLAIIALGFILFFAFDLQRFVTLDTLRDNRAALSEWVAAHYLGAILIYIAAYTLVAALSLPVGLVATITGGFLFGTLVGGLATVVGATIGATILFIAAQTAFADLLRAKAGSANAIHRARPAMPL